MFLISSFVQLSISFVILSSIKCVNFTYFKCNDLKFAFFSDILKLFINANINANDALIIIFVIRILLLSIFNEFIIDRLVLIKINGIFIIDIKKLYQSVVC